MTKEEISKITNCPGIYCIKNNINNKCYIGQSINLRTRLYGHYRNGVDPENLSAPLYRAISKYGIENFSLKILWSLHENSILSTKHIKVILDSFEVHYIEKYNSYNNGYNQTKGGDGGILGYKMTDEQKEKIRLAAIENCTTRKTVYAMNVITKKKYKAQSTVDMARYFRIDHTVISKCANGIYKCSFINEVPFVFSYTLNFPDINVNDLRKKGHFQSKYSLEEFTIKVRELNKTGYKSMSDISELLGICKKTVVNYSNKLKEQGIFLFKTR